MARKAPSLLGASALRERLSAYPGWARRNDALVKVFGFPTYRAGLDFALALGKRADRANHHPDLTIGWRKVTVRWTTHDAGGITEKDLDGVRTTESLRRGGRDSSL